ncbi:hypothetical protein ACFFX0_29525 [Citricoccus parietis]|uniref:Uncharacterized protein n=1 Tax=Citricoccus parietis TaxID=592307 RepID=A0ABV5G882_9MICC
MAAASGEAFSELMPPLWHARPGAGREVPTVTPLGSSQYSCPCRTTGVPDYSGVVTTEMRASTSGSRRRPSSSHCREPSPQVTAQMKPSRSRPGPPGSGLSLPGPSVPCPSVPGTAVLSSAIRCAARAAGPPSSGTGADHRRTIPAIPPERSTVTSNRAVPEPC